MSQQSRTQLKTYFQTGDIPTQGEYVHLIDSSFSIKDHNSGSLAITGGFSITGSGDINIVRGGSDVVRITGKISSSVGIDTPILRFNGADNNNIIQEGDIKLKHSDSGGTLHIYQDLNGKSWYKNMESATFIIDKGNDSTNDIFIIGDGNQPGVSGDIFFRLDNSADIGYVRNMALTGSLIAQNISSSGYISGSEFIGNISASYIVQPFNSHITASGHISASQAIYGTEFKAQGIGISTFITDTSYFGNGSYKSKIQGTNILLDAPVTASIISARGTVTAEHLHSSDDCLIGDDLEVSGATTLKSLYINQSSPHSTKIHIGGLLITDPGISGQPYRQYDGGLKKWVVCVSV